MRVSVAEIWPPFHCSRPSDDMSVRSLLPNFRHHCQHQLGVERDKFQPRLVLSTSEALNRTENVKLEMVFIHFRGFGWDKHIWLGDGMGCRRWDCHFCEGDNSACDGEGMKSKVRCIPSPSTEGCTREIHSAKATERFIQYRTELSTERELFSEVRWWFFRDG